MLDLRQLDEDAVQLPAFVVAQHFEEPLLDLGHDHAEAGELDPSGPGQFHDVASSVDRVPLPRDEPTRLQVVDRGHHVGRVDPGAPAQLDLGGSAFVGQRGQQPRQIATGAGRGERFDPDRLGPCIRAGQQPGVRLVDPVARHD